jgi:tetratricopeptide (TPR) repeat protein
LGVTLYELLTQRPAFPGDDRQHLLRQIIHDEPIAPRRLNSAVPVDLETIVLTAMAKSREERYPSARALADDLERFLSDKPTLARRPTLADRAAKWTRRHRPLVALGACALAILSIVSAVGVALLVREQGQTSAALSQAQQNAEKARQSFERAERHFLQARGAVDQFGVRLADQLLEIPGTESVRRDVLVETLRYYQQFVAEAGDDPALRHELALAHFKSGVIAAKLGATTDAMAEYAEAQRLLAELTAHPSSNRSEMLSQLAVSHNNLGLFLAARGDVGRARNEFDAATAIKKRLLDEHPADPVFASQLAESQANLGMLLDQTGDALQAERSLRAAVDVLRPLAESPAQPKYARNLAIASNNLSFVLRKRDQQAAEQAAREAIGLLEHLVAAHPAQIQYQDDLALCYNNLAALVGRQEGLSEAIDWHSRAIALYERLVRKAPAVVRHRSDLAIGLNNLGVAHCRAGQAAEADKAFARARELLSTLADDYPAELVYRSSLAALLNNQALALAGAGRHEDALAVYPTAIESQRLCLEQKRDSAMMREVLSKVYYNYSQSLQIAGRLDEAADAALERRKLWGNNGERLFGVAVELADIARRSRERSGGAKLNDAKRVDAEVVKTLRQAYKSGWPGAIDLPVDERFAYLHDNEQFSALIDELKDRPIKSRTNQVGTRNASSSTTN